jgi:hypothetical protein
MFHPSQLQWSKAIQCVHVYVLLSLELKKMLVLSVNGVLCYFPPLIILQENVLEVLDPHAHA